MLTDALDLDKTKEDLEEMVTSKLCSCCDVLPDGFGLLKGQNIGVTNLEAVSS